MARGSGGSVPSLLKVAVIGLGLVLTSCSSSTPIAETTTVPPAPTPTTSTTTTTTTTLPPTTTTLAPTTTTAAPLPDIDAEVRVPDGNGPFPAVVLVHGGGWVAGSPSLMRPLAIHLTDAGFLTVNARYMLSNDRPGYPGAMSDVACAVRYATAHPDSDGTVAVVGHSAGAHISAVVALTGDDYTDGCEIDGTGVPDRLVGLAGPYDVFRLGPLMLPFFGTGPINSPDAWFAGNPMNLADRNTGLSSLLMHGDQDGLVEYRFTGDFDQELRGAGSESLVEIVEGARHNDMYDPDFVGDLIIVWLER